MEYQYARFTPRVVIDELRAIRGGLSPGALLPHFVIPTADGGTFNTASVVGKRPIVIALASVT